jgi:sulfate adenylyltransferase
MPPRATSADPSVLDRTASPSEAAGIAARCAAAPSVVLGPAERHDLELLGTGGASPLRGYLGRLDHRAVLDRWRLAGGTPWPWPLTLAVPVERLAALAPGTEVALRDGGGALLGVVAVSDAWVRSPREEARVLFDSENPAHPGVAEILARPAGTLSGDVTLLPGDGTRAAIAASPSAVRRAVAERGWRRAAVFQPRGLPTRAQAQILRVAVGLGDGVVVQPLPEDGDPSGPAAAAALHAWREAAARLAPGRALVTPSPVRDRHGGGRDVLLQALVRRNLGASAFLVVREGDLLRPGDGLPADLSSEELGIAIVPFAAEFALPDGDALAA